MCWAGEMRRCLYDVRRMNVLIFGKVGFVLFADWWVWLAVFLSDCGALERFGGQAVYSGGRGADTGKNIYFLYKLYFVHGDCRLLPHPLRDA